MGEDDALSEDPGTRPWSIYSLTATAVVFFIAILSVFLILKHRRILGIIIKTFPRDCSGIVRFVRTFKELRYYEKREDSVADVFERTVARHPGKVCFEFEDNTWSFQEVEHFSNKIANYFYHQGYAKGDVVALFMENRPEYVCVWLGLSKIGVVTSLINSHLRLAPLKHCFDVSKANAIIFGTELAQAVSEAFEDDLKSGNVMPFYSLGDAKCEGEIDLCMDVLLEKHAVRLEDCIENELETDPDCQDEPKFFDGLFYIFTSGTTGLPKAAVIKHSRFMMGSISFHHMNCLLSDDIIYTCLPLYHTAGGLCGVGQALFYGNTVVLRRKFSASKFWKDCVAQKVTVAQYIGEICRYLLSQPSTPEEKQHRIRVMVGNGLRAEIWPEFVSRFRIRQVSEIYGSTDGNCNMVNFDNRVGAVGFVPVLLQKLYPMGLICVDEVTGEAARDAETGLAIRCEPNEPGELVGKIIKNHPIREFEGYAGSDIENSKKIFHDVFSKGDSVFRTGDLLIQDEYGYFYFKDRVGDTFRWKGENVSTAEVEGVLNTITDFRSCVVYGVQIPGTEGRAGMAAIADPGRTISLELLTDEVCKNLPSYARPLFIRLSKEIETTGTHKLKKLELQREGFNRSIIEDPLYFLLKGRYIDLSIDLYNQIINGEIRL